MMGEQQAQDPERGDREEAHGLLEPVYDFTREVVRGDATQGRRLVAVFTGAFILALTVVVGRTVRVSTPALASHDVDLDAMIISAAALTSMEPDEALDGVSCGIAEQGLDYIGNDLQHLDKIFTPEECAAICSWKSACKGWTWFGEALYKGGQRGQCWLKSNAPTEKREKKGAISGLRPCHRIDTTTTQRLPSTSPASPPPAAIPPAFGVNAGCFVQNDEGKLLIVKHVYGLFDIPGGLANGGEEAETTACRETWEESGYKVKAVELKQVTSNGFHIFKCDLIPGAEHGQPDPNEVSQVIWAPIDGIPDTFRFPEERDLLKTWMR